MIKYIKPIRKVKENCRRSYASYLASGSCRRIIADVNRIFTDAKLYENCIFKPLVSSSPSHFSGLVKFVRTDAKLPPYPGANMC